MKKMAQLNSKIIDYSWFTIIMKIVKTIPRLIDYKFQCMTAGPKCGMRFFDLYSDEATREEIK